MKETIFNPCVLIPVYNHENAISDVVHNILDHRLTCLLIDDGSRPACAKILKKLAASYPGKVRLICHQHNQGKGAAVMTGLQFAASEGFSHAMQIDADGQHCIDDIPIFIQQARINQTKLITGYPIYDQSIPLTRFYGRYLTHIWVWINTLSCQIRDSMCGFRVYPVQSVLNLIKNQTLGQRMTFDTEVLIHLSWAGINIVNIPTKVIYPANGISHFRPWSDNIEISCMHTRYFFGMLARLPKLLKRRRENT